MRKIRVKELTHHQALHAIGYFLAQSELHGPEVADECVRKLRNHAFAIDGNFMQEAGKAEWRALAKGAKLITKRALFIYKKLLLAKTRVFLRKNSPDFAYVKRDYDLDLPRLCELLDNYEDMYEDSSPSAFARLWFTGPDPPPH